MGPGQQVMLEIQRAAGGTDSVPVKLRIDTPIEVDYYRHGGILPFVLRELLAKNRPDQSATSRTR